MPVVAQQLKLVEARKNFKRPVVVVMSEKGHRFIAPRWQPWGRGAMQLAHELRKDLMASAQSSLESILSGMRDFQLVSRNSGAVSNIGVTVSDVKSLPKEYTFTVGISNVEVKELVLTTGYSRHSGYRQVRFSYVHVTVDVSLISPEGKRVFYFEKSVAYNKRFPGLRPDVTFVKEAVGYAVRKAMGQYVVDFGPPLYVDQTISGGLFVRLSAGTEYGIQPGQKVIFFQNKVQNLPTLPGEPPKTQMVQQQVATGVVGARKAPVERDHAWVYVPGNDDPLKRSVFLWTSARIAR